MVTTVTSNNTISQELLNSVNGTKSSTTSDTDEAQNRFMTLLIEQMKNQDPLNPMDNAQVTSQMAQLSTVTGVNKLNDTMQTMMESFQANQTYQASSMIGRSVLVEGNELTLSESAGYLGFNLDTTAQSANISIKNSSGVVVKEIAVSSPAKGVNVVKWDGLKTDGTAAEDGEYTFEATYTVSGKASAATELNFATVTSVTTSTSGAKLNLSNQSTVTTADIKEIY